MRERRESVTRERREGNKVEENCECNRIIGREVHKLNDR